MKEVLKSHKNNFTIITTLVTIVVMIVVYYMLIPPPSTKVNIQNGFLDLSKSSITETAYELGGEWEFYWDELLTPSDFVDETSLSTLGASKHFISIPGSWRGYQLDNEKLKGTGAATFRVVVQLSESDKNKNIALRIPPIFHSYKLWVNGELLSEVGKVSKSKEGTKPHLMTKFVFLIPDSDRLEIVVQVANFHHKRGGISKVIELGSVDNVRVITNTHITGEVFVTATLLVIGLYHLLLFYLRQNDRATLYFGLVILFFGIRALFVGEVMITQLIPNFSWAVQFKIEYLVLCICPYVLILYFDSIFPHYISRWFSWFSKVSTALFCVVVIVSPAIVYTQLLTLIGILGIFIGSYLVIGLVDAVTRKNESSMLLLIGSLVVLLGVINDYLYYNEKSPFENTFPLGLIVFTVVQMFLLSSRFTKAVANEERIARELQDANYKLIEMNINLEKIVHERTHDLSITYEELSMSYNQLLLSEQGRKKLLAYITHDLRMPLASMLGYVEAVQDMVKPEQNDKYLNYIRDNTIKINRMIEELSFLSHLETGQVAYEMKPTSITQYIQRFYTQYELVVHDAELSFKLDNKLFDDEHRSLILVLIDEKKLERALFNLVSNAMKFTPLGGKISIKVELQRNEAVSNVMIIVEDTGVGIPQELLEQIFDRNYKYENPDTDGFVEGSGLGLAICREIIQAHKGSVRAESDGKNGARFYVLLPCMH